MGAPSYHGGCVWLRCVSRWTRTTLLSSPRASTSKRRSGIADVGWTYRYEMRREAQEIIPGLYLGPLQSSLNLGRMNDLGITHVLCIRDKKEASMIFPRFPTEFRYMTLDISDTMVSGRSECRTRVGGDRLTGSSSRIRISYRSSRNVEISFRKLSTLAV